MGSCLSTSNKLAETAAKRLGSLHGAVAAQRPASGMSSSVFCVKERASEKAVCVRLANSAHPFIPFENDASAQAAFTNTIHHTIAVSNAGLGPAVIGFDNDALVTEWCSGSELSLEDSTSLQGAERLGRFFAQLHKIPLLSKEEQAKARVQDLAALGDLARVEPQLLQQVQRLSTVPIQPRPLVWTHGDLHSQNILESSNGSLILIDNELAGARPAVSDIAYFFAGCSAVDEANNYVYPSYTFRHALARAYLTEMSMDQDPCDLLWEVELEVPFQSAWLGMTMIMMAGMEDNATRWAGNASLSAVAACVDILNGAVSTEQQRQIAERGLLQDGVYELPKDLGFVSTL